MNLICRDKCAITGESDLEELYTFKKYPLYMGCTDQDSKEDIFIDMDWVISRNSGLIQLKNLIPLNILYKENHSAVIGKIWERHHEEFAKFININKPNNFIFEIGGAHGVLSVKYDSYSKVNWTILEPNPIPVKECRARYIKGFISEEASIKPENSTIVHSHVLEHIYDPSTFIKMIKEKISIGTKMFFSLPNMEKMLTNYYSNCINFEHTIFITEPYVQFLLDKYGFKLIQKKYYLEDHSIFWYVEKVSQYEINPSISKDLYQKNIDLFNDYKDYYIQLVGKLNHRIKNINKNIYLFGAHVFSQHLIANGLETTHINSILDNDIKKQGRRLYGTKFIVKSPKILANEVEPCVILKAGVYTQEIKEDILKNINSSTVFLE